MKRFNTPKEYAEAVSVFCVENSRSKEYLYPGFAAETAELVAEVLKYLAAVRFGEDQSVSDHLRKAILKEAGDHLFFSVVPDVVLGPDGLDIAHDPNTAALWDSRKENLYGLETAVLLLLDNLAKFSSACAKEVREPETADLRHQQRMEAAGDMMRPLATICNALGCSLREVAEMNYDKLADRFARGVICGDGGSR